MSTHVQNFSKWNSDILKLDSIVQAWSYWMTFKIKLSKYILTFLAVLETTFHQTCAWVRHYSYFVREVL